jgi:hypothetical protein
VTTLFRGVVRAYTAGTHKADVQPVDSLATNTVTLPVATDISPDEVIAGRECAVLLFTDDNPDDGVVVTVHGAVPLTAPGVAPKNARYFTLGLNSVLTNEHSLDDADESTITAGKDINWKFNEDTYVRLWKIHNIGVGDFTVHLRGGDGCSLGLGLLSDAHPRIFLSADGSLSMGDGSAPPAAKLQPGAAGVMLVGTSTKFQFGGAPAWLPVAQNITAVGQAIIPNALVNLTANASYTLTSTPTIASGDDGQLLIIRNVDTVDVITVQDQGTLAGSNLRLGAATRAIGPRDVLVLQYSNAIGDWAEVLFQTVI